ncbi:MAG: hypothetical protein CL878_03780 [Dehalococcoidia bacterium]|nr:hypothetical protein [Dehalococcoidia bacterium]
MATATTQDSPTDITDKAAQYLEAIYLLISEDRPAIAARVAEIVGVTPPTVLETLRRLQRQGLIRMTQRKEIRLTEQGREHAERLMRRHRLMERFLTDVLGLDWRQAHEEAERLEHAVSPLLEERLAAVLGDPATCPHGNPIPGSRSASLLDLSPQVRLSECSGGQEATVVRIEEAAEWDLDLLTFFERHRIKPGETLHILVVADFNDTITVETSDGDVVLGKKAAERVWVHPTPVAVEDDTSLRAPAAVVG